MKKKVTRDMAAGLLLAALLLFSGCVGPSRQLYGSLAPGADNLRPAGRPVFMPENAPSISQGYTPVSRDPGLYFSRKSHEGLDIIGKAGTPVLAPAAGVVIHSYYEPLSGNNVGIDHGRDGNGRWIKSGLFHLDQRLVKVGDRVVRGQQIGTLGRTGLLAAGLPHVHYNIQVKSPAGRFEYVNPHRFWADGAGVVTCFDSRKQWPDQPFTATCPVPCRGVARQ
ncbi:MAG: M23 family metallopeptidase [Desulfobacterales bacterium]|nr:M23 family metallopeptidase [Desulfobacterales bacterium]